MSTSVYTGLNPFHFIRKQFLQICLYLSAQRLSERTVDVFMKSCIVFGLHHTVGGFCFVLLFFFCFFVLFLFFSAFFFFFTFGNADLFCLILQLGWCCHSNVCGIPHCVPEVHGKFYAWPDQDKSYPLDGRVSSRTRNLFWLPGDSDSDTLQFCNNYEISQCAF